MDSADATLAGGDAGFLLSVLTLTVVDCWVVDGGVTVVEVIELMLTETDVAGSDVDVLLFVTDVEVLLLTLLDVLVEVVLTSSFSELVALVDWEGAVVDVEAVDVWVGDSVVSVAFSDRKAVVALSKSPVSSPTKTISTFSLSFSAPL